MVGEPELAHQFGLDHQHFGSIDIHYAMNEAAS